MTNIGQPWAAFLDGKGSLVLANSIGGRMSRLVSEKIIVGLIYIIPLVGEEG